ncbi:MAG: N-acetylmuramoyl-L-alanine amidase [Patescibacteria group bacterium]
MQGKHTSKLKPALAALFMLGGGMLLWQDTRQPETEIKTADLATTFSGGTVVAGKDTAPGDALATDSFLTYESAQLETGLPRTNAIGISWRQEGGGHDHDHAAVLQVRTKHDDGWSGWVTVPGAEDKKDTADPAVHSAILLTAKATGAQYRFIVEAEDGTVKLSKPRLTAIDATVGPDPTKRTLLGRLFGGTASAISDPRVYSRTEWGGPSNSPGWHARYYKLDRVMVHHTVSNATTSFSGSAANVRAIWDYHTNTLGWGDIGYNYLVDQSGHIFQGRYFDKNYVEENKVVVEAGHTFGYNDRSIGIAALGDFRFHGPSSSLIENIGKIAGYNLGQRNLRPWSWYTDEAGRAQRRLAGHRNYTSTSCPGGNLYNALGSVRDRADVYAILYGLQSQWDYSHVGQGVDGSSGGSVSFRPGETAELYLDLKNQGEKTWRNDGANPVRLGTNRTKDRASGFAATWLAPSRTGTFDDQSGGGADGNVHTVEPNETARFSFTVTAPTKSCIYKEYFLPVSEGIAWFPRDIGVYWRITVEPDIYRYQWVTQSNDLPTDPNRTADLTLDIKNVGNIAWRNDGANPVRLGTDRPQDRGGSLYHSSWIGPNRITTFDDQSGGGADGNVHTVEPNETARFSFTAHMPDRRINIKEYVRPLAEGLAWMNDVGIYWPVVLGSGYQAAWVGQAPHPTIDKSDNPVGSFHVDLRNTGTFNWYAGDVVRLGTERDRDRASAFATFGLSGGSTPALPQDTDNWLAANRTGSFVGKVLDGGTLDKTATAIAPGEVARFTVAFDARDVAPGTYREYFRLVAERWYWLKDYGIYTDVTVTD